MVRRSNQDKTPKNMNPINKLIADNLENYKKGLISLETMKQIRKSLVNQLKSNLKK